MRPQFCASAKLLLSVSMLLMAMQTTSSAPAATFCVETQLFDGAGLVPFAKNRILFDNGLVYDLPQINDHIITCYDPAQKRILLFDRQRQVQTVINTDELIKITAQTRAQASAQQKVKFGLQAKVQESKRVIGYSIQYGDFEYNTTTQSPDDPSIAADYGRFALLASQLNIVRRLGPPPFGRMTLNSHIAKRKELPLETTLTIGRGDESKEFRSTHQLVTSLSDADQESIKEVRGMMTLYQSVKPRDFSPHDK